MRDKSLEDACKFYLSPEVYNALRVARISMPRITDMAALKAFQLDAHGPAVNRLRAARIKFGSA